MKICKLYLVIVILMLSNSFTKANNELPRGIDLGEYAFGIPVGQLGFNSISEYTLSFWMNVKEFNHTTENNGGGTNFVNIRNVYASPTLSDWGYMWSNIGHNSVDFEDLVSITLRDGSNFMISTQLTPEPVYLKESEWRYFTFVFDTTTGKISSNVTRVTLYIDGVATHQVARTQTHPWDNNSVLMIGGRSLATSPLDAYIDKVQLYKKAFTQPMVCQSKNAPILDDESLLGYWDFEDGCVTDAEGFMQADNGTIKATMYNILKESDSFYAFSCGDEIKPFTFGEGVDPESVIQGVEESITEVNKSKAFVSNEILNIENAGGINSVVVYDATGKVITSVNANGATSTQIALPLTIKGVIMVKVNNEVVKVII